MREEVRLWKIMKDYEEGGNYGKIIGGGKRDYGRL